MTQRHLTRRLILLGCGAGLATLACGDDAGDGGGTGATTGTGGATGTGATTGTGGAGTGGATGTGGTGTGGSAGAGGAAGACGAMLLVKGSNYSSDPHDLTIPLSDIVAGVTKKYTTTGTTHDHDITLTEADFTALQKGETVKKYVCLEEAKFTDHEFAISCADPNIQPALEGEIGTPSNCPG
ncbi:MAG TPA: hypothetical protein PKD61_02645 [Polyangiaceae bacterium]|nr:hypothetical protein [Polyangiaceae bacterium]